MARFIARVAEQATATIPREQMLRIEIKTYHGFAWSILKTTPLCCARGRACRVFFRRKRATGWRACPVRRAPPRQRRLFDEEGLIAFDLFPSLIAELLETVPLLARADGAAYPFIIVDEVPRHERRRMGVIERLGDQSRLMAGARRSQAAHLRLQGRRSTPVR